MPVVGTAGHVDHGKTLLVTALTGVDTDRLPEEKKRGMTIDLGFTHFLDPEGRPIGVIDVPGHERYIRNMVAGAWGVDCALLVVAADDGWMPQTETHARVLSVFGVKRIILVLNKIDLVSTERLDAVEEDARKRAETLFGYPVPVVRVSARTGEGVEALKKRIVQELGKNAPPESTLTSPSPLEGRMYIDRVFSLKGVGTIVAGSLKEGSIQVHDELLLLPRKERVRVRRIQSYHRDLEEVRADESTGAVRVALNLHGISTLPDRGDCLVPYREDVPGRGGEQVERRLEVQKEFLAVGYLQSYLRAKQEAEIAFGTAHQKVTVYRLAGHDSHIRDGLDRLQGGKKGSSTEAESTKSIVNSEGFVCGQVGVPLRLVLDKVAFFRQGDRFLLIRAGGADILGWGTVLWAGKTTPKERHRVVKLFLEGERLPAPPDVEKILKGKELRRTEASTRALQEANGQARLTSGAPQLSSRALKLYQEIQEQGDTPWELKPGGGNAVREDIDRLCKEIMILPLDSSLYLVTHAYRSLLHRILKGRSVGSRLTIGEAKEATGLSRKYILPLLNRMERDGWVKRWGDDRVICRAWDEGLEGKA